MKSPKPELNCLGSEAYSGREGRHCVAHCRHIAFLAQSEEPRGEELRVVSTTLAHMSTGPYEQG